MSLAYQVLLDSPAFLWAFDDPSGTSAVDLSGNARHGTYSGSPSLASATVLPAHKAWDPDGSNDYALLAYDVALAPGTGDFLIEFWMKGTYSNTTVTGNDFETVFSRDVGDSGNGIEVYTLDPDLGTQGALRVWCGGSVLNGNKRINDGKLHHVWIERRSGVLGFYVDDVLDVSATRSSSANGSGSAPIYVARDNTGTPPNGTDTNWLSTPIAYMAYYVGTIPSSSRRTVHYQTGIREGNVFG